MAQHIHSHTPEQPAQTEGKLIRWAPYYDLMVNVTSPWAMPACCAG